MVSQKLSSVALLKVARERPLVCATILAKERSDFLRIAKEAFSLGCDLVELRIDHLDKRGKKEISEIISSSPLPVIATVRSERDGGLYSSAKETRRLKVIEAVIDQSPAFVDLELELSTVIRSRLIGKARLKRVGVILSHHDLRSTPSPSEISRLAKIMFHDNPDVAKLVFTPKNSDDVSNILEEAGRLFSSRRLYAVFGMSKLGKATRLTSTLLGCCLVYCSLGRTSRKLGQIKASEVISYLSRIELIGWNKTRRNRHKTLKVLKEELKLGSEIDPEFDAPSHL